MTKQIGVTEECADNLDMVKAMMDMSYTEVITWLTTQENLTKIVMKQLDIVDRLAGGLQKDPEAVKQVYAHTTAIRAFFVKGA